jgi:serine/threonine-protein kinase HipA
VNAEREPSRNAHAFQRSRQSQSLTKSQLASAAGVSVDFITSLEEDKPTDRMGEVLRVVAALNGVMGFMDDHPKLRVAVDGQRMLLASGGLCSTHFLRVPSERADDLVNEAFCLALARAVRIDTVDSQFLEIDGRRVLLVTRYDRAANAKDGSITELHQEHFCQVLREGFSQYEDEGGPNLKACLELLRRVSKPSHPQILHLIDQVIFNALVGHFYASAMNFALLYRDEAPVLAPLHDVMSTAYQDEDGLYMALSIGGEHEFRRVLATHWHQLAEDAGLQEQELQDRMVRLATKLPQAARSLGITDPFVREPVVERIVAFVERQSRHTQGLF